MYKVETESVASGRGTRYVLTQAGAQLTYSRVLELWSESEDFRYFYTKLLADSPYSAFRWETPALCRDSVERPFEFVLLDAPSFRSRATDRTTYEEYFDADPSGHGVLTFENLSGDATLVVPSPRTDVDAYGHLADFVRLAPTAQLDALWREVANAVTQKLSGSPLWLSTAGGGVASLHVRLDSRPKYYGYSPYKQPA